MLETGTLAMVDDEPGVFRVAEEAPGRAPTLWLLDRNRHFAGRPPVVYIPSETGAHDIPGRGRGAASALSGVPGTRCRDHPQGGT